MLGYMCLFQFCFPQGICLGVGLLGHMDAGRDWGQEEKETTEDEMVGWHHQHDRHEFE